MKVTCKECFRIMRSDHLKRHMKQHEESKQVSFCEVSPSSSETSLNTNFNSESTCNMKVLQLQEEKLLKN